VKSCKDSGCARMKPDMCHLSHFFTFTWVNVRNGLCNARNLPWKSTAVVGNF